MAADNQASERKGPAKIADVAKLADVSVATVSRALANPDVVTEATRLKVLEAVRATGYTPNVAARNLRARKTMMVLVVVPDIANTFFSEVLRGIDETLAAEGFGFIIANLANSTEKEARYVDLAFAGQVDGVLLLCGHVLRSGARSLADASIPLVAVCESIPAASFPQVEIDNESAARAATDHLVARGHRRIAYISGPSGNVLDAMRLKGYRASLAAAPGGPLSDMALPGDFTFAAGSRAARTVLELAKARRPTAVFAANDEMAIGFMKAVQSAGYDVPRDFAVAGFDGIAYADYCQPTLTTVVQPRQELGAAGAAILVKAMRGEDAGGTKITRLKAELVVRGTS